MKEKQLTQEIGLLHRSVNSIAVLAAVLLLGGCTYQLSGLLAASGYGGTISQEVIDSEPRPPKQVVFRFDEHRYIENDPSGGFVGGCQGEMYYVDEKLGIKTQFGGNKTNNPKGLFKVDSPYVVVRDEQNLFVSFDKGKSFVRSPIYMADVAVDGDKIYLGSGPAGWTGNVDRAFDEGSGIVLIHINLENKSLDVVTNAVDSIRARRLAAPLYEAAKSLRPNQFFVCKDLPWRPSVKRERERAKALATQSGGVKP